MGKACREMIRRGEGRENPKCFRGLLHGNTIWAMLLAEGEDPVFCYEITKRSKRTLRFDESDRRAGVRCPPTLLRGTVDFTQRITEPSGYCSGSLSEIETK